jgi:mannose-6-phosphate isomerase-like protein (cupin superfamily)
LRRAPATTRQPPSPRLDVQLIDLSRVRRRLNKLNEEIRYADCFAGAQFTAGVIAFRPSSKANAKQIRHADKDVLCHVIEGRGRLRIGRKRIALRPGTVCHVRKGTPHDFTSGGRGELVLFYSLIKS